MTIFLILIYKRNKKKLKKIDEKNYDDYLSDIQAIQEENKKLQEKLYELERKHSEMFKKQLENEPLYSRIFSLTCDVTKYWFNYITHNLYVLANLTYRMFGVLFHLFGRFLALLGYYLYIAGLKLWEYLIVAGGLLFHYLYIAGLKLWEYLIVSGELLFHYLALLGYYNYIAGLKLWEYLIVAGFKSGDIALIILRFVFYIITSFFHLSYLGGVTTFYNAGYYIYSFLKIIYG